MRKILTAFPALLICISAVAQDDEIIKAATYLSGVSQAEEADESWVLLLEHSPKVRVNSNRLRAGILSDYQVASIRDYRSSHGDILSPAELALLDGFSQESVDVLRPFLSFESRRLPGQADTSRIHAVALVRTTLSSIGTKARAEWKDYRAGIAWRGQDGTFYADADTRLGRLTVGDMNLRFGQGLVLWSGFSMTSLSTVDAFIKRSTGISPVWSYNSSSVHRGVAYEYAGSIFSASGFWSKGVYCAHAEYLWLSGIIGLTASSNGFSLDGRYNRKGFSLALEAALRSGKVAATASARFKGFAFQIRAIPSAYSGKKYGEYALAGGYEGRSMPVSKYSFTMDAALLPLPGTDPGRLQIRAYGNLSLQLSPSWTADLRLTERYRNFESPRTDIRADLRYGSGPWLGVFRAEAVRCSDWGFLSYLEGGRKTDKSALYIRLTGFSTASWNSRIYCYERDAPGTFSVPAYSGKGITASIVGGLKFRIWRVTLKGNLRAASTFRVGRAPAYTLNFQLQATI